MKHPLDNRNYYMIEYSRDDGKKGCLNLCILESGWWMAFDNLQTNPNNYIDNLLEIIRSELFNVQIKKGLLIG